MASDSMVSRIPLRFLLVAFVAAWLSGCAGLVGQSTFDYYRVYRFREDAPEIRLRYTREDQATVDMVGEAMEEAVRVLADWAPFRKPITVTLHPNHDSLERAVRRPGYPWLRGWAKYDSIDLQSPRTWGGVGLSRRVRELVVHEMTHILMYQYVGDEKTWSQRTIPLWFREGHASFVAKQGYRRAKPRDLAAYYCSEDYRGDPLTEPNKLLRDSPELVYGIGHAGFSELMKTATKEQIIAVYRRTDETGDFRASFKEILGVYLAEWEDRFREQIIAVSSEPPKSKALKELLRERQGSATDAP